MRNIQIAPTLDPKAIQEISLRKSGDFRLKSLGISKWVKGKHQKFQEFALSEADSVDQNKINSILLQRQTEEHSDRRTIWYSIRKGEFALIPKKIENLMDGLAARHINIIDYRDAVGSTIVHVAYLYNQYKIARWFVQKFSTLSLEPYSSEFPKWLVDAYPYLKDPECPFTMPYSGQNILHMIIMRRQLSEARWLLDFYRVRSHVFDRDPLLQLLKSKAEGNFFQKGGQFYFGGYPLHFAVCTNDTDMFDLVLAYSAASVRVANDHRHALHVNHMLKQMHNKNSVNSSLNLMLRASKFKMTDEEENEEEEDANDGSVGPNAIFLTDMFGNTALHLCVLHHLKEMYSHVLKVAEAMIKKQLKQKFAYCKQTNAKSFILSKIKASKRHPNSYALSKTIELPGNDLTYDNWVKIETEKIIHERLIFALNEDCHNPLSLIASIDYSNQPTQKKAILEQKKKEMLAFLIEKQMVVKWTYGPITCSVIPLEGLEISFSHWRYLEGASVTEKSKGAIEWLCVTDSQPCFMVPVIKKVIESKWTRVGGPILETRFKSHLFLTLSLTIITCYIGETPTFYPTYTSEIVVTVMYPIVLLQMAFLIVRELPIMLRMSLVHYYGLGDKRVGYQRGASRFGKISHSFVLVTFLLSSIFKFSEPSTGVYVDSPDINYHENEYFGAKFFMALCMFVCWISTFQYLMAFDSTGPFVLTISRIINQQIPFFLQFYVIMLIGFGSALSMLTNNGDPTAIYGFVNLFMMIFFLFQSTVGQPYTLNFSGPSNVPQDMRYFYDAVLTLFFAIVVLMMLNLLIAMINQTFKGLEDFDLSLLLIEKYNILCSLEKEASESQLQEMRLGYTMPLDIEGNNLNMMSIPKSDSFSLTMKLGSSKHADKPPQIFDDVKVSYNFEIEDVDLSWWDYDANGKDRSLVHQKISLLIIDPQMDFHQGGSLAVPGADDDSLRIAGMIRSNLSNIHEIFVTMDPHYRGHIAHSKCWQDIHGHHPTPFTQITYKDIWKEDPGNSINGIWLPTFTRNHKGFPIGAIPSRDKEKWLPVPKAEKEWWENYDWVLNYVSKLEAKGREKVTIWPVHCLVGTRGHAIVSEINDSLQEWAQFTSRQVTYVMKGQNCRTEMYSALQADVEDPLDPTTSLNEEFLSMLKISDRLIICGQALSHCVKYTTLDILDHWHKDCSRICILEDGCSSVRGFEEMSKDFLKHCSREGVKITTTDQAFKMS